MRRLADSEPDPWSRSLPLHFTASAVVVHPDSGRVLLRWHQRQRMWLQAGGHGDPGETDPLAIALREAREETSLPDLVPWPDGALRHAVVCRVAPGKGEPAHEHADVRFIVATCTPEAARPESPDAPLRWVTIAEARDLVGTNNLRRTLDRAESLLALPGQHPGGDVRPRQRDAPTARRAGDAPGADADLQARLAVAQFRGEEVGESRHALGRPGPGLVVAVGRAVEVHRSHGRDLTWAGAGPA